jgi:hypothetical protein
MFNAQEARARSYSSTLQPAQLQELSKLQDIVAGDATRGLCSCTIGLDSKGLKNLDFDIIKKYFSMRGYGVNLEYDNQNFFTISW